MSKITWDCAHTMPAQNNNGRVPLCLHEEILNGWESNTPELSLFHITPLEGSHWKPVKGVQHVKDLGVTISSDLSWNKYVRITINNGNKVLGIIKWTVGTSNRQVFSTLYKSFVRSILEYAIPVWNPHLAKNVHALEKFKEGLQDWPQIKVDGKCHMKIQYSIGAKSSASQFFLYVVII